MNEIPIGCIFCYPSPISPDGFLPCDGRELSKKEYSELYAVIKNTWGETEMTFFLPDLQGQFVRGWDKDENIDPQRKFGSEQADTLQGHSHELFIRGEISEARLDYEHHNIEYGTNTIFSNNSISFNSVLIPSQKKDEDEYIENIKKKYRFFRCFSNMLLKRVGIHHSHELPKIKIKDAVSSTFQEVRTSVETRPKNIALMYCIKAK